MKRILVIDDEASIRRLLEISLSSIGWEVFQASSGFEGLEAVRGYKPDVVLLDLNLPDMKGSEMLYRLRSWSSVPVIVVSVRDSESDIVQLLKAGADDYVVKPFYINELIARIEAVQRRRTMASEEVFKSGKLSVDLSNRQVTVGDETIHLTPTEYALLALLVQYAGRLVTREFILKEIWGPAGQGEEGNLRFYVNALRKKIEEDPSTPLLVTTEAGVGYRLELLPATQE